jgi:hypothetical protein
LESVRFCNSILVSCSVFGCDRSSPVDSMVHPFLPAHPANCVNASQCPTGAYCMADALAPTPRYLRVLRITWTLCWVVAALLLVVLWIRSYWWVEIIHLPRGTSGGFNVGYIPGLLAFGVYRSSGPNQVTRIPTSSWANTLSRFYAGQTPSQLAGGTLKRVDATTVLVPFWIPTLGIISLGLAPWFQRVVRRFPCRFSLRTLLLAITLLSILLGLVVWLTH